MTDRPDRKEVLIIAAMIVFTIIGWVATALMILDTLR